MNKKSAAWLAALGLTFACASKSTSEQRAAVFSAQVVMVQPDSIELPKLPGEPLGLAIAITRRELRLFSISGKEGTQDNPQKVFNARAAEKPVFDTRALVSALQEIVTRRWPDPSTRPEKDKKLILQVADDVPYEVVIQVMDAVHEFFPHVLMQADAS